MPTIAIIDGVKIMIFANDHPPPHFHAKYAEFKARISIATGAVIDGSIPPAKLNGIRTWFAPRQEHIAFVWTEIQAHRYPEGLIP